jgi:hypothetical protein
MPRKLLAAAAVVLACAGCGSSHQSSGSGDLPPRTFVQWDATAAVNFFPQYKTELINVIQHVAAERGQVFAAVIDGQPITTANIASRNFAEKLPDGEEPESSVVEAAGDDFAHQFTANCTTREVVRGSGQLQGLLIAADTPGVREVVMFTDGIVNENGFDLSDATPSELQGEIARWKPKLTALKNMTVVLVGVGRGVHQVATVEAARHLFHEVVEGNGGHLQWLQTLAQR